MSRPSFAITTNTPVVGLHKVEVDGHDISGGVRKAVVWLDAGEYPVLDLEVLVHEAQRIEAAEADITIPDDTRRALIRLGWTPPPDAQDEA